MIRIFLNSEETLSNNLIGRKSNEVFALQIYYFSAEPLQTDKFVVADLSPFPLANKHPHINLQLPLNKMESIKGDIYANTNAFHSG